MMFIHPFGVPSLRTTLYDVGNNYNSSLEKKGIAEAGATAENMKGKDLSHVMSCFRNIYAKSVLQNPLQASPNTSLQPLH